MWSPRIPPALLLLVALLVCGHALPRVLAAPSSAPAFVFKAGAVLGTTGDCADSAEANIGYQLFADTMERQPLYIRDRTGTSYPITFQYTRLDNNCSGGPLHAQLVTRLLDAGTQFLFGSSTVRNGAQIESEISNQRGIICYHCCVTPDQLYEQDLDNVFGMLASNKKYPILALKSMSFAGIQRLVIAYRTDNLFTSSTCLAAIEYLEMLQKQDTDLELIKVYNYTEAMMTSVPNFFANLVDDAIAEGVQAFMGCELSHESTLLAQLFHDRGYYLEALFLTIAPAMPSFVETLGKDAAAYTLTAVQWHPAMRYPDFIFGSTDEYVRLFKAKYGRVPSYIAAGASAVGVSLAYAIQEAFQLCDISGAEGDSDRLLFDPSAITCHDPGLGRQVNTSGYQAVLAALTQQSTETIFGPVEFNKYRRNVAKIPATTQIQSGVIECVLPLDAANKPLVMPIPKAGGSAGIGSLNKTAFIVIIVLGSLLVLLLLGSVVAYRVVHLRLSSQMSKQSIKQLISINPSDLDVIRKPMVYQDQYMELGKARYRGGVVALEPLVDLAGHNRVSNCGSHTLPLSGQVAPLLEGMAVTPRGSSQHSPHPHHLKDRDRIKDLDLKEICREISISTAGTRPGSGSHQAPLPAPVPASPSVFGGSGHQQHGSSSAHVHTPLSPLSSLHGKASGHHHAHTRSLLSEGLGSPPMHRLAMGRSGSVPAEAQAVAQKALALGVMDSRPLKSAERAAGTQTTSPKGGPIPSGPLIDPDVVMREVQPSSAPSSVPLLALVTGAAGSPVLAAARAGAASEVGSSRTATEAATSTVAAAGSYQGGLELTSQEQQSLLLPFNQLREPYQEDPPEASAEAIQKRPGGKGPRPRSFLAEASMSVDGAVLQSAALAPCERGRSPFAGSPSSHGGSTTPRQSYASTMLVGHPSLSPPATVNLIEGSNMGSTSCGGDMSCKTSPAALGRQRSDQPHTTLLAPHVPPSPRGPRAPQHSSGQGQAPGLPCLHSARSTGSQQGSLHARALAAQASLAASASQREAALKASSISVACSASDPPDAAAAAALSPAAATVGGGGGGEAGLLRSPWASLDSPGLGPAPPAAAPAGGLLQSTSLTHAHGHGHHPAGQALGGALSEKDLLCAVWQLRQLQHPNVVPVTGVALAMPGCPVPVLVTEHQELGGLGSLLENETVGMEARAKLQVLADVAAALHYVHAQDHLQVSSALSGGVATIFLDSAMRAKLRVPLRALKAVPGAGSNANSLKQRGVLLDFSVHRPLHPQQLQQLQPIDTAEGTVALSNDDVRLASEGGGERRAVGAAVQLWRRACSQLFGCRRRGSLAAASSSIHGTDGTWGSFTRGHQAFSRTEAEVHDLALFGALVLHMFGGGVDPGHQCLMDQQSGATTRGAPGQPPAQLLLTSSQQMDAVQEEGGPLLRELAEACLLGHGLGREEQLSFGRVMSQLNDAAAQLEAAWQRRTPHVHRAVSFTNKQQAQQPPLPVAAPQQHRRRRCSMHQWRRSVDSMGAGPQDQHTNLSDGQRGSGHGEDDEPVQQLEGPASCMLLGPQSEGERSEHGPRVTLNGMKERSEGVEGALGSRASLTRLPGRTVLVRQSGSGVASRQQPPGPSSGTRHVLMPSHGFGHGVGSEESLLYEIFPPKVADALRAGRQVEPESYEVVSIFFSDIVGYTDICGRLSPAEVMTMLDRLYTTFDSLMREFQLFKVETIGDAYMAVSNLRDPQPETHAKLLAAFAFAAIRAANSLPVSPDHPEFGCITIRVGLHSGPVVGSVVGLLNRRYCLFGDTVNVASRMESTSEANRVHCSPAFYEIVRPQWPGLRALPRGPTMVKGKGLMKTFFLEEPPPEDPGGQLLEQHMRAVGLGPAVTSSVSCS